MNILTVIEGGAGKNVLFTAVLKAIKRKYQNSDIIVVTAYPEIYLNNPNVYRVVPFNTPYFHEDYIKNADLILSDEVYKNHNFLKNDEEHLIKSWCEMWGLDYMNDKPSLTLTKAELINAFRTYKVSEKPILLFQPFGGGNKDITYSWNRDIPYMEAQEIVDRLSGKFTIIKAGFDHQPKINNCHNFNFPNLRALFSLARISDVVLCIDSVVQHACAALNKPANVCWITNKPEKWGYDIHRNFLANPPDIISTNTPIESSFLRYDFTGSKLYDCPYVSTPVFNVEQITSAILA